MSLDELRVEVSFTGSAGMYASTPSGTLKCTAAKATATAPSTRATPPDRIERGVAAGADDDEYPSRWSWWWCSEVRLAIAAGRSATSWSAVPSGAASKSSDPNIPKAVALLGESKERER